MQSSNSKTEIVNKQGVLCVVIEGDPKVSDIKSVLDQIRNESGYLNLYRFWDFRLSKFDFSAEDLQEIASYASSADNKQSKVAMLVGQDLSFGVSRMYEVYRQTDKTAVKVFREESEAMAWLHE